MTKRDSLKLKTSWILLTSSVITGVFAFIVIAAAKKAKVEANNIIEFIQFVQWGSFMLGIIYLTRFAIRKLGTIENGEENQ